MRISKNTIYSWAKLSLAGVALAAGSCTPEDLTDGNGLKTDLQPTFSVTPVQGRTNTYFIKNTTPGALATKWDIGSGAGLVLAKMTDTVFYPDAGSYTIKMQAMGKGGIFYDAPDQTVDIAVSDPVAGNLVQGGRMNPEDESKWAHLTISPGVSFALSNGQMVATGGNWGHAAIYQPIEVQAGKKYRFGMAVSGSGASDVWLEVYFGTTPPVAGSDYSSGGNMIGLNTWSGCGNAAFSGNLATLGCEGALKGKNGEVTFAQSGTIYLLIKTGGANLGTSGITIDNVELRGM